MHTVNFPLLFLSSLTCTGGLCQVPGQRTDVKMMREEPLRPGVCRGPAPHLLPLLQVESLARSQEERVTDADTHSVRCPLGGGAGPLGAREAWPHAALPSLQTLECVPSQIPYKHHQLALAVP